MRLGRRSAAPAAAILAAALGLVALAGCGGGDGTTGGSTTTGASKGGAGYRQEQHSFSTGDSVQRKREPATLVPSHCPPGHPACRTTEGRIVYIEHVDPDGDGDAHFVVIDPQSITLPGLTAIDVRAGLRPHPLPKIGDRVSAAGPVQVGHLGQDQIHALELHVAE